MGNLLIVSKRLRQPYDYTKRFLNNRITPYENRVLIKVFEKIKHLQYIKKTPITDLFEHKALIFDAADLVLHHNVDKLEVVLKRLRSRNLEIETIFEGKKALTTIGIISSFTRKIVDIGKNKGKVKILIHEELYHYMLNLSNGYTSFLDNTAFNLSNSYSLKMYYHISHWMSYYQKENSKKPEKKKLQNFDEIFDKTNIKYKHFFYTIEDFKKDFNVPINYRPSDIIRRILIPAKKELDKKSELSFNYTANKKGNKIVSFSFNYTKNKDNGLTRRLTNSEQNYINATVNTYSLNKLNKSQLAGLIFKYNFDLIRTIASSKWQEIEKYMNNKKYPKNYVESLGVLCEGETKKSLK